MNSRRPRSPRRQSSLLPRKGSRWRFWLTLAAVSVGWKVLVFTLGAALPRWLITDGIEQLPAPLQDYGREAKQTALALWNGPLERHGIVRTVRVVSVHGRDGRPLASTAGLPNAAAPAPPPNDEPPNDEPPGVRDAVGGVVLAAAEGRDAGGGEDGGVRCDGHGAVVRAYTYFGIPYSEARTRCDTGVVEYRVFRRRKPPPPPPQALPQALP